MSIVKCIDLLFLLEKILGSVFFFLLVSENVVVLHVTLFAHLEFVLLHLNLYEGKF